MLLVLGFDASTMRCPIVVGRIDGGRAELLAFDDEEEAPNQTSTRLVARIERVVGTAGIEPAQLGAVACGRGPGTFTGVRVALATAKGIAVGLGVDVIPVSSLRSLALSAAIDGLVLPLLDARRGEVYGGLTECRRSGSSSELEASIREVTPERVAAIDTIVDEARAAAGDRSVIAVGTGAHAHRDQLPNEWLRPGDELRTPNPEGLLAATLAAHIEGAAASPAQVEATYLRKSYAELGINKPKRPFVKSPFV